ncbi:hypothetical protein K3495_g1137 [Podosphaera aphanis]|nr:hypothetical protein K3495_g1137 [Podosphaera aphanis]
MMTQPSLPAVVRAGNYDGTIPASKWLFRLKYDFRPAGYNNPPGETYLEAIEMLLDGPPVNGLAASPRIKRIVISRLTATDEQITEVNKWLMEEFPEGVEERAEENVQPEIQNFA